MTSEKKYRILLHAAVPKEIKKLPKAIRLAVKDTIDRLARDPIPRGASKLKGRPNAYRIRIKNYRIIYEVNVTEIVIYVIEIAHRKEVYLRILKRRFKI